jgi:5-methylcytosine-specific restriction endonuclease McrA
MRTPTFMRRTQNSIASHRKRAREAGQVLDYGLDELRARVEDAIAFGHCHYCQCSLTAETFACDHATPTSRAGSFGFWNVEVICTKCNRAKGILTAGEFAGLWAVMREWESLPRVNVQNRLVAGGGVFRK